MNKIALELEKDSNVKRYIELRKIILSNDEYIKLSKTDLSLNKANISNLSLINLINEYQEREILIKNDLSMIGDMINSAININFL